MSIVLFASLSLIWGPLAGLALQPKAGDACSAAEHRQFDFWIGSWTVADANGKELGRNEISRVSDGCGLLERWSGREGGTGTSLNFYDSRSLQWRQLWVGGGGLVLRLSGEFDGESMVLKGERTGPRGVVLDQIRWTALSDGRVRQEWETSADGGDSWSRVFLGYYSRRK